MSSTPDDDGSGAPPERPASIIEAAVPEPKPEPEPTKIVIKGGRTFLRDLPRHPASWPLPAWMLFGMTLLVAPDIWLEEAVGDCVFVLGLLSVGYWGATVVVNYTRYTTFGLRAPSDEEVGCAIWLVRAGCLVALYWFVVRVFLTYS